MTKKELRKRVRDLERRLDALQAQVDAIPTWQYHWDPQQSAVTPTMTGGITQATATAGESGAELFIPAESGRVFNINAFMPSDPKIGRKIVEAIQAYERQSGARWREDPPPQRAGVVA